MTVADWACTLNKVWILLAGCPFSETIMHHNHPNLINMSSTHKDINNQSKDLQVSQCKCDVTLLDQNHKKMTWSIWKIQLWDHPCFNHHYNNRLLHLVKSSNWGSIKTILLDLAALIKLCKHQKTVEWKLNNCSARCPSAKLPQIKAGKVWRNWALRTSNWCLNITDASLKSPLPKCHKH